MQLSKFIAKMASVMYLSASVGAFFSADYYRRITDDFFSNAGLIYVAGFITALIGLLIVGYHNRWVKNWTVLITLLGWLALLKGIFLIAFPQFMHVLSERMFADFGSKILPYATLCLGLLFAYFGFVSTPLSGKSVPPAPGG